MPTDQLTNLFRYVLQEILSEGIHKIEHCVDQLTDEQVWWRPATPGNRASKSGNSSSEMNSIANLMLHLAGNVRQWIISGVGGAKDVRNRPLEFSDHSNRSKAEILRKASKNC